MKDRSEFLMRLAERIDLPSEPITKQPLVEIIGRNRVLIENHRGVCDYGKQSVLIRVSCGQIRICGEGLELARMTKEQVVIMGKIGSIVLLGRDE